MFGCSLTPKAFQLVVNGVADSLLLTQVKVFVLEILIKIQQLIMCVTGVDIVVVLKYFTILAVLVWLYNLIKDVIVTYLCWFKSRPSPCSSSSSSDDCDDCGCN